MTNDHETAARDRKAGAIARSLHAGGVTSATAATLGAMERLTLATKAGQNNPSAETWDLVLGKLAALENAAAAGFDSDPFDGLPGNDVLPPGYGGSDDPVADERRRIEREGE